jgi:hypothetical protein
MYETKGETVREELVLLDEKVIRAMRLCAHPANIFAGGVVFFGVQAIFFARCFPNIVQMSIQVSRPSAGQ